MIPLFLKKTENLYQEAWDLVEEGDGDRDLRRALKISRLLQRRRYSGGFEISAKVHAAWGRHDKAFSILEEGLRLAPNCSPNLLLLGTLRSDQGKLQEAIHAFRLGIVRFPREGDLYRMNLAESLARAKEFDEALNTIRRVHDREWSGKAMVLEASVLQRAGRQVDAEALAVKHLAEGGACLDESDRHSLHLIKLNSQLSNGRAAVEVLAELKKLPRQARMSESGLGLLLEARGEVLESGRYHRINACWEPSLEKPEGLTAEIKGCFVAYQVFCRDEQQAVNLIEEFEGRRPVSTEMLPADDSPKDSSDRRVGIVWISGLMMYGDE